MVMGPTGSLPVAVEPRSAGLPRRTGRRTPRIGPTALARSSRRHGRPGLRSLAELATDLRAVAHYSPVQRPVRTVPAIAATLPATLPRLVRTVRIGWQLPAPRLGALCPVELWRWPVARSDAVTLRRPVATSRMGRIRRRAVTTARIGAVPILVAVRPATPVHGAVPPGRADAIRRPAAGLGVIAAGRPEPGTGRVAVTLPVSGRWRVADAVALTP